MRTLRLYLAGTVILVLLGGLGSVVSAQVDETSGDATGLAATSAWTTRGDPEAIILTPNSVNLDPDGDLWVLDGPNSRFQIISPDGEFLEGWGTGGTGEGEFDFRRPDDLYYGNIAFAPDGGFYVADTDNKRIQRFDADRAFVTAWGGEGEGEGQFLDPIDVAVSPDGRVYVSDDQRDDVQVFDPDGTFLFSFGGRGSQPGQIFNGGFIDIASDGTVFLADYGNNRVQKLSADGEFIAEWGGAGDGPLGFDNPHGIAVGPDGLVYLADFRHDQVKVFDQDGIHIATWGDGSDPDGIELLGPVGIAVGDDGSVYVSEYWARDVEKLAVELANE